MPSRNSLIYHEDEEHEEDDDSEEVEPGFYGTERWFMYLCSVLQSMSVGVLSRGGAAVNDKSSESGGVVRKVYSPATVTARGLLVTINNVMWRPRLPLIPEEEEVDDIDDNGSDEDDEKFGLVANISGTATAGASNYVEAINEVSVLMASSGGAHQPASARDVMFGLRLPQIFEETDEEMGA